MKIFPIRLTCQLEKDIDLTQFPHRRTITFAARLAGYGPIISALREHKHFGITMAEDVVAQGLYLHEDGV